MSTRSAARRADPEAAPAAPEQIPFRAVPHNIEAEQALLGAILINNEAQDRVSGFLEPHHFYDPLHQQIYETCAKLIASGKQATPITLKTFFETAAPIDPTLTVLRACAVEAEHDPQLERATRLKMEQVLDFLEMLTATYDDYKHLPPATMQRFLKMGGKVARLLGSD